MVCIQAGCRNFQGSKGAASLGSSLRRWTTRGHSKHRSGFVQSDTRRDSVTADVRLLSEAWASQRQKLNTPWFPEATVGVAEQAAVAAPEAEWCAKARSRLKVSFSMQQQTIWRVR